MKSEAWPNEASIEISKLAISQSWTGLRYLDHKAVAGITASLEPQRRTVGKAASLVALSGLSFKGVTPLGSGFIMSRREAEILVDEDKRNRDVLFPYLIGRDLNEDPEQQAARWIINFFDWSIDKASSYGACFRRIESSVKIVRQSCSGASTREKWWQYQRRRPELYRMIARFDFAIVLAQTSSTVMPARVPANQVLDQKLVVFAYDDTAHLGLLY